MAAPAEISSYARPKCSCPTLGVVSTWSFAEGFECNGPLCNSVKAVGHFRYWPKTLGSTHHVTEISLISSSLYAVTRAPPLEPE
jgi:hypothetical protein